MPTPSELEAQQERQKVEDTPLGNVRGDEHSLQEGTANSFIVDWDGENDPANPMNWDKNKRISQVVLVSAITMVTSVVPLKLTLHPEPC